MTMTMVIDMTIRTREILKIPTMTKKMKGRMGKMREMMTRVQRLIV